MQETRKKRYSHCWVFVLASRRSKELIKYYNRRRGNLILHERIKCSLCIMRLPRCL